MGKDSLIKSTSKKKKTSSAKKDEDTTKVKAKKTGTAKKSTAKAKKSTKAAPKKAKSATKTKSSAKPKTQKKEKAAPKKKAAAKTKAAPKKKTAAKAKTAPKAKKTVTKPKKKVSIKELTLKKFDLWKTAKPAKVKTAPKTSGDFVAPSFFTTSDKDELKRLKTLLLQKIDYDMLKKASDAVAAEKAAEKAAAEKAEAEKAAAEKAAAEKAAQEKKAAEPKPAISYEPPPDIPAPSDPADKMMTYGIGGLLLLIFLLVGASFLNADNYYIKPVNGAVEIWQGKFAPKGDRLLISLPGEKLVSPLKPVYDKKEVFPLIFAHYKDKAVMLMEVEGMPDFDAEKAYLEKALAYSTTSEEKGDANARINTIDLMVLLSKADAAASRNTVEDLTTALKHLDEAADLDLDDIQKKQVQHKTDQVKSQIAKVKQQEAKAKAAAKEAKKGKKQADTKELKKKKSDAKSAAAGEKAPTSKSEKAH